MKTVKELLKNLEIAEIEAEKTENEYEAAPMDEVKENAFDIAYKNEFNLFMKVSKSIAILLNIDIKNAREMVRTKREEIEKILIKSQA